MLKKIEALIKSIPRTVKCAFVSAVVTGLAAHYFAIATKLTNHDDMREVCNEMVEIYLGRWLLSGASDITGNMSLTFDSLLAVFYIALAAAFVTSALKLRSVVIASLAAAFMATFPTLTFNNLFNSTADVYALAIMLMGLGAFVAVRAKNIIAAIILPLVMFTASLGIYQAYLGFALGIMILSGISQLVYEDRPFREVLFKEIRYAFTALCSVVLYIAITKFLQKFTGTDAISYQGVDKMGEIDLAALPYLIRRSYTQSIGYYVKNSKGMHYGWLTVLFVAVTIASLVFFILHLRKREGWQSKVLAAVLAMLLPMGAGVIYLMGPENVHLMMIYGFVTPALFLLLIADRMEFSAVSGKAKAEPSVAERIYQGAVVITIALAAFCYITLANKVYTVNYYVYEESYSYAQTVATVIRTTPGYSIDTKIYMVGKPASHAVALDEFYEDDSRLVEFENSGIDRDLGTEYTMPSFYWYFLGLTNIISEINLDKAEDLGAANITVFPEEGSTYMGDGYMVIRFE